jgi:hypothetical protein
MIWLRRRKRSAADRSACPGESQQLIQVAAKVAAGGIDAALEALEHLVADVRGAAFGGDLVTLREHLGVRIFQLVQREGGLGAAEGGAAATRRR